MGSVDVSHIYPTLGYRWLQNSVTEQVTCQVNQTLLSLDLYCACWPRCCVETKYVYKQATNPKLSPTLSKTFGVRTPVYTILSHLLVTFGKPDVLLLRSTNTSACKCKMKANVKIKRNYMIAIDTYNSDMYIYIHTYIYIYIYVHIPLTKWKWCYTGTRHICG